MSKFLKRRSHMILSCCSIFGVVLMAAPARCDTFEMATSCAETWLSQNKRVSMYDALSCIATWSCAHANNPNAAVTDVVAFEACREITLDALKETKHRDARLATDLQNMGLSTDAFWFAYGIRPQALARCAIAQKNLLESRGTTAARAAAERAVKVCMMPQLAPDAVAELSRLGVQYQ